jgi:hypothetical protein
MGSLALRAELPGQEKKTVRLFYCTPDPRPQGGDQGFAPGPARGGIAVSKCLKWSFDIITGITRHNATPKIAAALPWILLPGFVPSIRMFFDYVRNASRIFSDMEEIRKGF